MKNRKLKLIMVAVLISVSSCDEPETIVTNIISPDGSITRKVEMRSGSGEFGFRNIQVPMDSTWIVRDSLEVSEKGDTIWVRRAEKLFSGIEEINQAYQADSSCNKEFGRSAEFSRKFRWFHTSFRFAEIVGKTMKNGYPVADFLNGEELEWFYSPRKLKTEKLTGPDSLKFEALADSVDDKKDLWMLKSITSEWIDEFNFLAMKKGLAFPPYDTIKAKEPQIYELVRNNFELFDSLWSTGFILREIFGEEIATNFSAEADSALDHVGERVIPYFSSYTVGSIMPGRVTATNGFVDSSRIIFWPVDSEFFMTEPYKMWVESKVPNRWAWVVSGLFVLFVFSGIVVYKMKKG